jgi:sugar phosphate isomerase/epimerase
MPTIEEIIAEVPADGPSGKVGMATAERIVAALKAVGYDGYIVLETGHFGDHHASAKAAGDYLKSLV